MFTGADHQELTWPGVGGVSPGRLQVKKGLPAARCVPYSVLCVWHFPAYALSLLAEARSSPTTLIAKPTHGSQPPGFQSRATKDAEKEGPGCWGGVTAW